MHPWVAQQRERVGFALQVDTLNDDPAPTERVLAAGRLAEELGFDAFLTGDHPTWAPEVWLHMAALAARRIDGRTEAAQFAEKFSAGHSDGYTFLYIKLQAGLAERTEAYRSCRRSVRRIRGPPPPRLAAPIVSLV